VSVRKAPPSIKVPDMFMALDAFTQLYYNTLVELQDMREEVAVEEIKRKEFEHKLDELQNHLAEAEKRLLVSSLYLALFRDNTLEIESTKVPCKMEEYIIKHIITVLSS